MRHYFSGKFALERALRPKPRSRTPVSDLVVDKNAILAENRAGLLSAFRVINAEIGCVQHTWPVPMFRRCEHRKERTNSELFDERSRTFARLGDQGQAVALARRVVARRLAQLRALAAYQGGAAPRLTRRTKKVGLE